MNDLFSPRTIALRILAVASLLIVVLIGLLIREDRARASGQDVRLAMEGFDPRSLLSGHYAALQFTERLPGAGDCPPDLAAHYEGPEAWVALSPAPEGHHQVSGGGATRQAAARHGAVVVRGQATCQQAFVAPPREQVTDEAERPEQRVVTLDVGISRFYADQEAAEALEAALREAAAPGGANAFAIVSVGRDGRARLKGVEVAGVRTDLSWF